MKRSEKNSQQALLRALNRNVSKLATRMEKTNYADFVELNQKPLKLIRMNFMAGLFRGVGMFLGGSIMGAVVLALLTWGVYYFLKVADMIPVLSQLSQAVADQLHQFMAQHPVQK